MLTNGKCHSWPNSSWHPAIPSLAYKLARKLSKAHWLFPLALMPIWLFMPVRILAAGNFTMANHSSLQPLPIVPLCLLRCKDNHMLSMDSEWSSDFVFPLLGMLRSDRSREQISRKVKTICEQNAKMGECLRQCPPSIENEILQMGLQPWEPICDNLRILETQIGCWKQNIEPITQECSFESQQLRHSTALLTQNVTVGLVETICVNLRHLSACFVAEYGKHCGTVSQRLVRSLFESSREVIAKMLRVKWADLPTKCQPDAESDELSMDLNGNSSSSWAANSSAVNVHRSGDKMNKFVAFISSMFCFLAAYFF